MCDLSGNLLHISDPLPGKTHDAKTIDDTGLRDLPDNENAFGDEGYIGTRITTINKIRYIIERAIAHFKAWRCMYTDYRRPKRTYVTASETVRVLHFFKLSFT